MRSVSLSKVTQVALVERVAQVALVASLVLLAVSPAEPADSPPPAGSKSPPDSGLVERVEVREVQLLVTAWPKDGDAARCRTLTKDDFTLEVNGAPTPIVSFLPYQEVETEVPVVGVEPAASRDPPLSLVILIDEFHHSCPACALRASCCGGPGIAGALIGRHAVYETARRMLRESFRPGDRVLVATMAVWPQAETGWLEDPAAALARLDELEQGMRWVGGERAQSHVINWYPGMISFFRALGLVDGPKDVIFPTCHFPLDADDGEEIRELAAVALENDVVLHTVDIMICSLMPKMRSCQPHEFVGPLAANLGGKRFGASQGAAGAVAAVRRVAGCRFLVSFRPDVGRRGRIGHTVRLATRRRAEFDLRAPTVFADRARRPSAQTVRDAMFLMPDLRQGYLADAGVWPLRRANHKEWESLVIVHVERQPGFSRAGAPEEVIVDVVAWRDDTRPQTGGLRLRGDLLASLRASPMGRTFAFPLRVRPGENNVSVIVQDPASKEGAVWRRRVVVPDLEVADRGGWWIPAGRDARLDGMVIPTPAGSRVFQAGEAPRLLGLECGAVGGAESGTGDDAGRGSAGDVESGTEDDAERGTARDVESGSESAAERGTAGDAGRDTEDDVESGTTGDAESRPEDDAENGSEGDAGGGTDGEAGSGAQTNAGRGAADRQPRCVDERGGETVPARIRYLSTSGTLLAPPPNCRWVVTEPLKPLPPGRWSCGKGMPVLEVVDGPL